MGKVKEVDRHIKAVEGAVEHIAFVRRSAELAGLDMEEFDKKLDALCTKYHDRYAEKNEIELALTAMAEIIKSGHGDELIEDLAKSLSD